MTVRARGIIPLAVALALPALAVAGCDTFFVVDGTLTACATGTTIAGAQVVTATDPGAWDGPETVTSSTDAKGHFAVGLNKPSDEAATLTFSKPGFVTLSHDYPAGVPTTGAHDDFCLDAAPP